MFSSPPICPHGLGIRGLEPGISSPFFEDPFGRLFCSLLPADFPDALMDFRAPRFDLDNLYGRGPDDDPYAYEDGRMFLLG